MVQRTALVIILILTAVCFAQDNEGSGPAVRVSGSNQLLFSQGTMTYDPKQIEGTGDYLTDYLDFDIGIKNFFVRGTFQVNSPSLGYNPIPEIFREFFSRRTIGFTSKNLHIEGGHFTTVLGKGLTLNLRENRKTEKNYLLDGILLTSDLPWLSLQVLAGRSIDEKSVAADLVAQNLFDLQGNNLIISTKLNNLNYRDNIMAAHGESFFPFSAAPALSLLSASSFGGGMVYYGNSVKEHQFVQIIDTTDPMHPDTGIYDYTNRNTVYLPSGFVNLSSGSFDCYAEYARMIYQSHEYSDSLMEQEITEECFAYAGYISTGISFLDFYLLGEYKNYFYQRKSCPGFQVVKNWVEPPDARHKHGWHLLTKHTLSKAMDDNIGYNTTLTWSGLANTIMTADFNVGGVHTLGDNERYSLFTFSKQNRYWEVYSQWDQTFNDWLQTRIGFDIGVIDHNYPDTLSTTAGAKIIVGPFADRHSFELIVEGQYNIKNFNEIDYTQDAENVFIKPLYNFSPYLSLFCAFEREVAIFENYTVVQQGYDEKINYYFSGGLTLTPVPNHVLSIEGGSMSGRMECNPPPCTYIWPFKGVKVTLNSTF